MLAGERDSELGSSSKQSERSLRALPALTHRRSREAVQPDRLSVEWVIAAIEALYRKLKG